jgi:hypothetical protein
MGHAVQLHVPARLKGALLLLPFIIFCTKSRATPHPKLVISHFISVTKGQEGKVVKYKCPEGHYLLVH